MVTRIPIVPRALLLALAVSLLASGCNFGDNTPSLEGTEWALVGGLEQPPPPDAVPTLLLGDDGASGFAGCNRFSGAYEVDRRSISIGPLRATLMACPEPESAAEQAFLPLLESVDGWVIRDGELTLTTGGEEVLRFAAS